MNLLTARVGASIARSQVALSLIVLSSTAIWLFQFTSNLPLSRFYLMPHLDIPKIMGVSEQSTLWFAVSMAGLWTLYVAAVLLIRGYESVQSLRLVLVFGFAMGLAVIPMFPGAAGDVYAYIAEADMVLQYHLNPFMVPVTSVPSHPILPFLDYPAETTHYGPLWLAIAIVLRLLSLGDLLAALVLFKLAALAFLLLTAWLVFSSFGEEQQAAAVGGAVLMAWNPLLLFETAGNAHNDVAMMAFVALAFFLHSRGSRRGAILSLVAACLVKYVAIVLLPLFLAAYLRESPNPRTWLPRVAFDLIALAVLGLALMVVVGTEGTFGILQKMTTWFTTSPGAVAYYQLQDSVGQEKATQIVQDSARVTYCILYLLPLIWVWLRPSALRDSALLAMLGFMLIETVWFQPWYVAWALPLAAIIESPLGAGIAFGMTLGGLAVHTAMGFAWRLWWLQDSPRDVHMRGAEAMWLPVLLSALIGLAVTFVRGFRTERRRAKQASENEPAALTLTGPSTMIEPDQQLR